MARRIRRTRRPRRKMNRRRGKRTTISSLAGSSVRPDRLLVRLPYQDSFILNSLTAGVCVNQVMNMNSIFDPDRTGIGHQPLGYNQWSNFYRKYKVHKVAYNVTFTQFNDYGTQADYGARVGVLLQNGVPPNTFTDQSIFEQPHLRFGAVGTTQGSSSKTFKGMAGCARVAGRPNILYLADDKYQANFGYNPSEFITLSLVAGPNYKFSQVKVVAVVRLVYYVELFDPFQIELSDTTPELRGPDPNNGNEKEPSGYIPTPLPPPT